MPALVNLTADEVAEANRLGDETWEMFKNRPGYYRNLQASHRKGKVVPVPPSGMDVAQPEAQGRPAEGAIFASAAVISVVIG